MKVKLFFLILCCFHFVVSSQSIVIPNTSIRYLALGDSYTIGESVAVNFRWPVQLKDSLVGRGYQFDDFKIIAQTGWTTSNLLNAITNEAPGNNWNMVSILIGVNNQFQNRPFSVFLKELPQLIDSAITYAGGDKSGVFIVSIPDYAYTPFGKSTSNQVAISAGIDQYNMACDSIAGVYGIPFVKITDVTREGINEPSLVANDGLHPSGKAYTEFVKLILANSFSNSSTSVLKKTSSNNVSAQKYTDSIQFDFSDTNRTFDLRVYSLDGKLLDEYEVVNENHYTLKSLQNFGNYFMIAVSSKGKVIQTFKFFQ